MKQPIRLTALVAATAFTFAPAMAGEYVLPIGHLAQAVAPDKKPAVVDDREISLRVQSALGKDRDISALSLSIKVSNGNVELGGIAPSQAQISRALEIVRAVPGVKSVRSEVRVS